MLSSAATLMLIKLGVARSQKRSSAIYTHLFVQKELREELTINVSYLVHDSLTRTARALRINWWIRLGIFTVICIETVFKITRNIYRFINVRDLISGILKIVCIGRLFFNARYVERSVGKTLDSMIRTYYLGVKFYL